MFPVKFMHSDTHFTVKDVTVSQEFGSRVFFIQGALGVGVTERSGCDRAMSCFARSQSRFEGALSVHACGGRSLSRGLRHVHEWGSVRKKSGRVNFLVCF